MKVVTLKGLKSPNKRKQILQPFEMSPSRHCISAGDVQYLGVEDFRRLMKLWVGNVYGSPAINGKVVVITLIYKNVLYTLELHEYDAEDRVYHFVISHTGEELSLYNICGLNSQYKTFYQNLGVYVGHVDSHVMILGAILTLPCHLKRINKGKL